jgi:hypothetical protein
MTIQVKLQIEYSTNADFQATYENMLKSNLVSVSLTHDTYGNIVGKLKESETRFLLSPKETLQVTWKSREHKIKDFEAIKNLLVPRKGEKLYVSPRFRQDLTKEPYPGFRYMRKYWCNEAWRYSNPFLNPHLSKKDRELMKLDFQLLEAMYKMAYEIEEEPVLFGTPVILVAKRKP